MNRMISVDYLVDQVIQWAHKVDLVDQGRPFTQHSKLVEETREILDAMLRVQKDGTDQLFTEIGDGMVVLIVLALQYGEDPADCLKRAEQKIRNRSGQIKDGSFVKKEDLVDEDPYI